MYEGLKNDSAEIETLTNGKPDTFIEPAWNELKESETDNFIFQLHHQYIVSQVKSGLMIIDQQLAHERVLYEQYLGRISNHAGPAQQNLFPQALEFSSSDFLLMKELQEDLRSIGFDLREFGANTFVLHGAPPELEQGNEKQSLDSLLEQFKNNKALNNIDHHENLARSMAKNMCIRKGKILSQKEMKTLIDELFSSKKPSLSVDGKATVVVLNIQEISKLFSK